MPAPPPTFAVTPDQRDLDSQPRDLRFHPCANDDPRVLTRAQVAAFNRDGYLKGLPLFPDAEADAVRRYFDGLLERVLAAG